MSQVYRASGSTRSYRPVRVLAREKWQPSHIKREQIGHAAVVVVFGACAIIDGILFALIGLR